MSKADRIVVEEAQQAIKNLRNGAGTVASCPSHGVMASALALSLSMQIPMYEAVQTDAEGLSPTPKGALAATLVIIKSLTPWRWPLALAVFSPFGEKLVATVITTWMTGKVTP